MSSCSWTEQNDMPAEWSAKMIRTIRFWTVLNSASLLILMMYTRAEQGENKLQEVKEKTFVLSEPFICHMGKWNWNLFQLVLWEQISGIYFCVHTTYRLFYFSTFNTFFILMHIVYATIHSKAFQTLKYPVVIMATKPYLPSRLAISLPVFQS